MSNSESEEFDAIVIGAGHKGLAAKKVLADAEKRVVIEDRRAVAVDLQGGEVVGGRIEKRDALLETWYAEPLTLIHGDSNLANCFEYDAPEDRRVG